MQIASRLGRRYQAPQLVITPPKMPKTSHTDEIKIASSTSSHRDEPALMHSEREGRGPGSLVKGGYGEGKGSIKVAYFAE